MGKVRRRVVVVRSFRRLGWAASVALVVVASAVAGFRSAIRRPARPAHVDEHHGGRPLRFERNEGQFDERIHYVARGRDYTAALTEAGIQLALRRSPALVRLCVVGGTMVSPAALDALPGVTNYFVGNDPSRWRTGVGGYGRVRYPQVLPGVDLSIHGGGEGRLEYDVELAAGVDPRNVALDFAGVESIVLARGGDAVLRLAGTGELREHRPVAYQTDARGARAEVAVRYELRPDRTLAFAVGPHDPKRPLVIDPVLTYSTYLGGTSFDNGRSVAVDSSGAAYVVGTTASATGFPVIGPIPSGGALKGSTDAFVTKLSGAGVLVYSTYLGGSGSEEGTGIAVDQVGSAYVAGTTGSTDLPFANNLPGGATDAFVIKLSGGGGTVVYSRYIGGSDNEQLVGPTSIAVDGNKSAYIVGSTKSLDFPVVGALQPTFGGVQDAFVTKLDPTGTSLVYSTYLGGNNADQGNAVAVDAAASAYVTGHADSADFPGMPVLGGGNAFVVKLTSPGALAYTQSIGGNLGQEVGSSIAVDGSGNAYVTGTTTSTDFLPVLPAGVVPFQAALAGTKDAFVAKLGPAGGFLYATFLGGLDDLGAGFGEGNGGGIAVDPAGNIFVSGTTNSSNFPTVLPIFNHHSGGVDDVYVTELNPLGSALVFSTFLGGSAKDQGSGIAVDLAGEIYVTGVTGSSADFPTAVPAQPLFGGGGSDAFVTKIATQVAQGVFGSVSTTCPGNSIAGGGMLIVTSGTCPGCVSGKYIIKDGTDILRVLYAGYHHDGTYDCNSGVRRALVANWSGLFQMMCPGQGVCTGIKHAWREADGSPITAAFITRTGFGGRTIPGVNPFCNSDGANSGMPSASGDSDYADKDPIRIPCDDNDSVCEADGKLGLVLPIVFGPPGTRVVDEYPVNSGAACTGCVLSLTGGGNAQPCPLGGPLLLGRCFQPVTAPGDTHCMALKTKKCFGDVPGSDGRAYNLPLKVPVGTEPAEYLVDANGHRMTGSFFRIHMQAGSTYSPTNTNCQFTTADQQVGCLVSADACSLGNAGPAALGVSPDPNQEVF
jgi:hypothetical protein